MAGSVAAPPQASPVGAAVPAIPGLDGALALGYLGGRTDVYRRVLRQFAQHYGETLAAPAAGPEGGDTAALRNTAHSIKGASASIGAVRLPLLAEALETALADTRPAAEVAQAEQAMRSELNALVGAIRDSLTVDETQPAALGDDDATPEQLDRLEALMAAADYEAVALLRSLSGTLRAQFGAPFKNVETPLRSFDYERALAALRALRATTPA
jgi:HPt (histidine-containing phosphotransfer) domain-containing protein